MKFKISRTSIRDFDHNKDVKDIHPRAYREGKQEFIDIEDLDDLVKLSEKEEIIIKGDRIELYDDYRE